MTTPRRRAAPALAAFLSAALLLAAPAPAQTVAGDAPQIELPRASLTAGMYRIDAQVASTPAQREVGLMHRRDMPQYEGMLFIFERPGTQCFWMKNTLIPLTAAFIADDGSIVNLADMAPMTETDHCSEKPVRYVLEMNQGWFEQHHLKAGAKLNGPMFDGKP